MAKSGWAGDYNFDAYTLGELVGVQACPDPKDDGLFEIIEKPEGFVKLKSLRTGRELLSSDRIVPDRYVEITPIFNASDFIEIPLKVLADVTQVVQRGEMKRWVWCTFQRAGFHYYEEAGTDPSLADVSFLANRHRHMFKFKVSIEVYHANRDLEFLQVLAYCESLFNGTLDVNGKSVEMIADDMYPRLRKKYPGRDIKIEVSEDGENGCLIEYNVKKQVYLA